MNIEEARNLIKETAESFLGLREDGKPNQDKEGIIGSMVRAVTDSRAVVDIGRIFRPGDAWCAAFASYVFLKAGLALEHDHGVGFYGCGRIILEAFERQVLYGVDFMPKVGDLVIFDWQGYELKEQKVGDRSQLKAHDSADHVGVIVEVKEDGVFTIEGNWRGGVRRVWRPFGRSIMCYCGFVESIVEDEEEEPLSEEKKALNDGKEPLSEKEFFFKLETEAFEEEKRAFEEEKRAFEEEKKKIGATI